MSAKKVIKADAIQIIGKGGIVLLDVFAEWCGPCKMLLPIIDEIALEADGFEVIKLNVDEDKNYAKELGVTNIPVLIYFKEGKEVSRSTGFKPKKAILDEISKLK